MTVDEAKKWFMILRAYVQGETLQICNDSGEWVNVKNPTLSDIHKYRIKPTYRPFRSYKDCWREMQKHQPFGWLRLINTAEFNEDEENYSLITNAFCGSGRGGNIMLDGERDCSVEYLFENYTFADGTPFGERIEWK